MNSTCERAALNDIESGSSSVADQAHDLAQRAGRDDHLDSLGDLLAQRQLVHGEPEAVGGGEGQLLPLGEGVDAGEDGAGVVGGGGELDLARRRA